MKRRQISIAILLTIIAALLAVPVAVAEEGEDIYSERTLNLARQFQCPICSGQSVADSNVTLARQMRDVIEQKVQAGETDEQIKAYFIERYGEHVLLDPPKSGLNLTLWWIPPAVLAVGALVVILYMREGRGGGQRPASPDRQELLLDDEELESLAREYLNPDTNVRPS